MENPGIFECRNRYIAVRKCIIGAWAMQKKPVLAGRIEHNGIAGVFAFCDMKNMGMFFEMFLNDVNDHAAKRIITNPADEPGANAEACERQANIGHRSARTGHNFSRMGKSSWDERLLSGSGRIIKGWYEIQANVASNDNIGVLFHTCCSRAFRRILGVGYSLHKSR